MVVKNFTQVPNEIFQSGRLSAKAIGLYCYLKYRSYFGNGEAYYPSQRRIMRDLNIGSDNTLRSILQELKDHSFLKVRKGSTFTGNSFYTLLKPRK